MTEVKYAISAENFVRFNCATYSILSATHLFSFSFQYRSNPPNHDFVIS